MPRAEFAERAILRARDVGTPATVEIALTAGGEAAKLRSILLTVKRAESTT